jgi:hypothetical protein
MQKAEVIGLIIMDFEYKVFQQAVNSEKNSEYKKSLRAEWVPVQSHAGDFWK